MRTCPLISHICSATTRRTTEVQLFGVEIELEGAANFIESGEAEVLPNGWRMTHDGSLRNSGIEFVSYPSTAAELSKMLPAMYAKIDADGNMDTSVRCGIHVHADMRERTTDSLAALFATYALVEPLLFQYCGMTREENIYCVPWYRAYEEAAQIAKSIRDPDGWTGLNECCKYSALFAGPLVSFGTIEFRMAPTWMESEKVMEWVQILADLVAYGKAHAVEEVLDQFYTDEASFLREVFMNTHPALCPNLADAIDLIYEMDTIGVAEMFLPLCTYKVNWDTPTVTVEGTGTDGYGSAPLNPYRATIQRGARLHIPEPDPEPDEYPDDYDHDQFEEEDE